MQLRCQKMNSKRSSKTVGYDEIMPNPNSSPPTQFSLKRMFVATALVAMWAWAFRSDSMLLAVPFVATCTASGYTGIGSRVGPIRRAAITGGMTPPVLAVAYGFVDGRGWEFFLANLILSATPSLIGAIFGAAIGAYVGIWHDCRRSRA